MIHRFARGEGIWYGNDAVYFACTNGGEAERGQIWRYVPSPSEGAAQESEAPGTLELFVEPNDPGLVDNADNLTVTPWGDLILCEDGSGEQFLVGIKPDGTAYKFARNAVSESELVGTGGSDVFPGRNDAVCQHPARRPDACHHGSVGLTERMLIRACK